MLTLTGLLQKTRISGIQAYKILSTLFLFLTTISVFAVEPDNCMRTRFLNRVYDSYNYVASRTPDLSQRFKDSYERLIKHDYKKDIKERVDELLKDIQDDRNNNHRSNESLRRLLEALGNFKTSSDGKSLNDYARDFVMTHRPDLIGTDYGSNPLRTLSYFIMLDPEGFVREVRIIRGPMGNSMTLQEAFEYYRHTDTEKAQRITRMINTIMRLYTTDNRDESLDRIIESLNDSVDLFKEEQ